MENYVHRSPRLGDRRSIIVRIGIKQLYLFRFLKSFNYVVFALLACGAMFILYALLLRKAP
jgi:hypothetical protein